MKSGEWQSIGMRRPREPIRRDRSARYLGSKPCRKAGYSSTPSTSRVAASSSHSPRLIRRSISAEKNPFGNTERGMPNSRIQELARVVFDHGAPPDEAAGGGTHRYQRPVTPSQGGHGNESVRHLSVGLFRPPSDILPGATLPGAEDRIDHFHVADPV